MQEDSYYESNKGTGLKGLQNLGNTCYINAALQALVHIKPLRLYFLDTYFRRLRLQWDNSIDALFCQFMTAMWSTGGHHNDGGLEPLVVLRALVSFIWKRYSFFLPGYQHDSQEFLQYLLSDLHDALKIPYYPESTFTHHGLKNYDLLLRQIAKDLIEFDFKDAEDHSVYFKKIEQFVQLIRNEQSEYKSINPLLVNNNNDNVTNENLRPPDYYENIDDELNDFSKSFKPLLYDYSILSGSSITTGSGSSSVDGHPASFSLSSESSPCSSGQKLKYRSIISDLFAGELENTIRCVNCEKTSRLSETFLSLSIPISAIDRAIQSKIQNSMIFPIRLSVPFNSTQEQENSQPASVSLFSRSLAYAMKTVRFYYDYFWNWFEWFMSFLNSPSVDLVDCLETFFNPELLENENRYHCENCKKLCNGIKCIRIKRLPEILVVHLNRYQNVNSMVRKITSQLTFPLIDFSLKSFLSDSPLSGNDQECDTLIDNTMYDLVAVICHSGTQVTNGHYICYALNDTNFEWYEFDDIHVNLVSKDRISAMASSAYILFYQRNDQQSLSAKALDIVYDLEYNWIESCEDPYFLRRLHLNLNDYYFFSTCCYKVALDDAFVNTKSFILSKYWVNSFLSLQNPGQIENSDIFCPHRLIRPTEFLFFNNLSLPVIEPVGRFLWLLYGGGPIFNNRHVNSVCPECSTTLDNFDKRRKEEFAQFHRLQSLGMLIFRKSILKNIDISIKFEKVDEHIVSDELDLKLTLDDTDNDSMEVNENEIRKNIVKNDYDDDEEQLKEDGEDEEVSNNIIIYPDGKTINLKMLESDENSYYYLISAQWIIKWLSFINVRFDQSTVPGRDRQLFALYKQIKDKLSDENEQNPYDEIYRKNIHLQNNIHPPLASLLRLMMNTMNKNQFQMHSDDMLKQIDLNLHTILPPGPIDNWSMFGIKKKILTENKRRQNENKSKKNSSNPWPTIDTAKKYEKLCSLISEMLTGQTLSMMNDNICQYKFSFHSKSGGVYEENSFCVCYLMSREYYQMFHDVYGGGPTITFNYLLNKFEANISVADIEYFIREHYSTEMKETHSPNGDNEYDNVKTSTPIPNVDLDLNEHIVPNDDLMIQSDEQTPTGASATFVVRRRRRPNEGPSSLDHDEMALKMANKLNTGTTKTASKVIIVPEEVEIEPLVIDEDNHDDDE